MTASNTAFTVFSAIGFILSLIPLWWHLEAWNIGTCMYMIWTALGCLVHFVDSIVWNGNTINWAPVWCDIGTFANAFSLNPGISRVLSSYPHSNRSCRRVARLPPLYHPSPSQNRFPYCRF